jgi:hypothetical protein
VKGTASLAGGGRGGVRFNQLRREFVQSFVYSTAAGRS